MKLISKIMLLATAFGIWAVVLTSTSNHPAVVGASGPGVTIEGPLPLPISGTIGVNNFPATQPVSGTVSVGNFPTTQPVSLTNTSTTPLFVDADTARVPASGSCFARFDTSGEAFCDLATVPSGKRLVLDSVSYRVFVATGQALSFINLTVEARGVDGGIVGIPVFLPPLFKGTVSGFDVYIFAGQLPVYEERAGDNLRINAFTADTSGTGNINASFTGHLVTP